jgi:hypothetical protein
MNHTPAEYNRAGFDYERGKIAAQSLRIMIESEKINDRAEARRMIESGRAEARALKRA